MAPLSLLHFTLLFAAIVGGGWLSAGGLFGTMAVEEAVASGTTVVAVVQEIAGTAPTAIGLVEVKADQGLTVRLSGRILVRAVL